METKHEKIVDELEDILKKNRDAEKGFGKAAENADSPSLRSYFSRKADRRREFNTQLQGKMRTTYTDYDGDGTFTGSIHRAWMDVKALFSADDDESMLEESIRGDKAAIEEYNEVLEYDTLAPDLRNLLISQRDEIQKDISQNKSLEDIS